MNIHYTEKAVKEVEIAFEWYNQQRKGLGNEFIDCIESSIRNIEKFPEMYKKCYSQFRRCVIRKFPYSIFYTIEDEEVVIHAIFDNRQDPQKRP